MAIFHNLVWIDCMKIKLSEIIEIPLTEIDSDNLLTDFSLDGCPEKLTDSVKVIGFRHPISVCPSSSGYAIVSGHKRFQAAPRSGLTSIPAVIIPEIDDASKLVVNLNENFQHRHYSDIEKGIILNKFKDAGVAEEVVIEHYMPLLQLERSKKILSDLSSVRSLSAKLKKLLHRAGVPVKTFSKFYKWDEESRTVAENLFASLKPGVNKWRELLDLIDEIATRENTTPGEIISQGEIKKILESPTPQQQYDPIHQHLYNQRFPVLSEMRKQVARALDEMELDDKTRLKFQDTFESNELKLELKFHSEKELSVQVEKIFKALQSGSVEKLIKIFSL